MHHQQDLVQPRDMPECRPPDVLQRPCLTLEIPLRRETPRRRNRPLTMSASRGGCGRNQRIPSQPRLMTLDGFGGRRHLCNLAIVSTM